MFQTTERHLKTGSDPRAMPDYSALRDELAKLSHPARPDVNWRYIERLCLSLFEQNGVELQTAAWYTLARTQLAGLFGLNEGLAILEALISHQWEALWPQPVHARMEILSSLSQRLQQRMRSLPFNYGDLSQLYRAEQLLTCLGDVLQRLELKHFSQLDTLRTLMHNSAVRLENSDGISSTGPNIQPGIALPASVINDATASKRDLTGCPSVDFQVPDSVVKWVYVAQPEQQPNVEVLAGVPTPIKKWKPFIAGMCTMLVITTVAVWGWQFLHRPDPLQTQLAASLAPFPGTLSPEQLDMLRQQSPLPKDLIAQTQQQLTRLDKLPPDWNIAYSRQLVEQARVLWSEQAEPVALHWQQQLNAAALPAERLNGWYQGMTTLQKLSDRLNGLDEQKGKYITVSELKSVVFSIRQSFNQSIPAEEQLRVLSENPAGVPLPAAARSQLEMHLKQLAARYAEIKQNASE
ncbi:VasL domain-containing protein [Enterobacter asburiae]|uniref:VasL domain-containing protein n=1 Tax=Enterobacter asburiae TaxID=61645 RepID=UPI00192C9F40|nr:VasL domain-containing protein [Enterobacter asburiae]MBL5837774.1 type VI secretion system ImpA family N-terminal domain-containing protein [Enterobacter asburiae]MBL5939764.1 type VI secretion system ImpA family N-terminal domain-containing protein [Enterobacter asburiae]MBL5962838.1 type VI secretion system ImpA family N-terminal domain-containing protein [Enterobacter asburiae]MBL5969072.1 type VI secretion system ImpA family N-terminal domain-containing protein [Enterobacter asburiae]